MNRRDFFILTSAATLIPLTRAKATTHPDASCKMVDFTHTLHDGSSPRMYMQASLPTVIEHITRMRQWGYTLTELRIDGRSMNLELLA